MKEKVIIGKVNVFDQNVNIKKTSIRIKGITPLLINKPPEGLKETLLNKELKKGQRNKTRDLDKEYREAFHMTEKGEYGIPACYFKYALVNAAPRLITKQMGGVKLVKGSVQILGNVLPLKYSNVIRKEDVIRTKNGMSVMVRPEFHDWTVTVPIQYDANSMTLEQIVNLMKISGFHVGVGCHRPQCGGNNGMFDLNQENE